MRFDFLINYFESQQSILPNLFAAVENRVTRLCVVPNLYGFVRNIVDNKNLKTKIYTAIDYPLGCSSSKTREAAVIEAIQNGTSGIDLTISPYYINNLEIEKIRKDISVIVNICSEKRRPLRAVIPTNGIDVIKILEIAKRLSQGEIDDIILGNGLFADDLSEKFILADEIRKNTKQNIVINTTNVNHPLLKEECPYKPYGFQINSTYGLSRLKCIYS